MSGLTITVLQKHELAEASKLWQALEAEVDDIGLTASWEWVETWLTHFGDLVDYWFVVGMKQNTPCGIALVTKETHRPLPFPVKAYHVGTNGEPYQDRVRMTGNTILAKQKEKSGFIAALIQTLMTDFSPEELVFDDYTKEEAETIEKILRKQQYRTTISDDPTLFLDLDLLRKNNTDVLSAFGSNMRQSVRRSLKVFGEITVEWAETKEQAIDILEELSQLYQKNQQSLGRAGMFASTPFEGFQRDIVTKLIEQKKVVLFRVKSKTYGTIGCLYMFLDKNSVYFYQIGLNDFSTVEFDGISRNRLKTSYIVHTLCMQECMKRGIQAYHFLIGVYRYKIQMTNAQTSVVTLSVQKSIKPRLRDSIMSLYARLDSRNSPKVLRILRAVIRR